MILTRTPFRISFFGGGTDYPAWCDRSGGDVLSTTINKYCYVILRYLPPFFDHKYRIRYTKREESQCIDDITHPSVRECLRYLKVTNGVEMVHTSDIPARSGVGSSSAFSVGFLNALHALKGEIITKRQLASEAIAVEIDVLKENVGLQDQVAAAFGGLNVIEFNANHSFVVSPVPVEPAKINFLEKHLMLFFTGFSRIANIIAEEQIKNTHLLNSELDQMKDIAFRAINILNSHGGDILEFGNLLDETWRIKKGLTTKITTIEIDAIYSKARSAGALGGKLLGAGGGGFILLFVEPELQSRVRAALSNILYVPFAFENLGSQITHYSNQDFF